MAKLAIRWTKIALADLENVSDFLISEDKPSTAKLVIQKILNGIEQTRVFPESGRKGRVDSTRELVIPGTPFIVVYRPNKGAIEVLTILHQARKWQ